MMRKNSMFLRVLISVICVMLLQTILITLVLFSNGTMQTMEEDAVTFLTQNVENRRNTLEHNMVNNWSNISKLEAEIQEKIELFLDEKGMTIDEAIAQKNIKRQILFEVADSLLTSLRLTSTTGLFMYFADPAIVLNAKNDIACEGVYFRDLDPSSTPNNYTDVQYLIGPDSIRDQYLLAGDSIRRIDFSFSPGDNENWTSLIAPFRNASTNPGLTTSNLSYWSKPHTITDDGFDTSRCITYNRPLFYKNKLIGMIGTDLLLDYIDKYIPELDFSSYGKGAYMLVRYDANSEESDVLNCDIYSINGTYIERAFTQNSAIKLKKKEGNIYIAEVEKEKAHVSLHSLNLYNSNTPFANDQIALIGIIENSALFATITTLQQGLLISSSIALLVGVVLLAIMIRLTTHPLIELAGQIKRSDPDAPLVMTKSKVYEIVLLNSTINAMKDKRKIIEEQLREERERYLIALENVADTFLEYDIASDNLSIYYFSSSAQGSVLSSESISNFLDLVREEKICPKAKIDSLVSFITGCLKDPIEVPIVTSLFKHINNAITDGIYYWFLLKSSYIYDEDNRIKKIICIARQITDEKLKQRALYEASRRDVTTKLYNEKAGLLLINDAIANLKKEEKYSIAVLSFTNYGLYEAYYGRFFTAALIMQASKILFVGKQKQDIFIRLDKEKFLLYYSGLTKVEILNRLDKMDSYLNELYSGENKELEMNINVAIVHDTKDDFEEVYQRAFKTLHYGIKNKIDICFSDDVKPSNLKKDLSIRYNPIDTHLNVTHENIVGFTFDIFEKTTDVNSVINLLLKIIGEMFNQKQIVICSYNFDFGTMQVTHQWNDKNSKTHHLNIEKVSHEEFIDLQSMMDENGTLVYNQEQLSQANKKLLCVSNDDNGEAFCCLTYENMMCNGVIIFKSILEKYNLNDVERNSLFEITKIISARISINLSHSASKAKSEFLSRISHEIRTPMNAIIGMTAIAKDVKDDPNRLMDALNKIDFSSRHLLGLINDVLDMSKIESGKLKIVHEPFSLDTLIESINILMRPQIENKQITFVVNADYQHSKVIGDDYHIRQVLVNFLGNASKFTNASGKITFTLKELEFDEKYGYFRFSVRDSGIGISKEDQKNIFLAFEQATSKDSKTGRQQGTGLGLAISSSIINAMGSKIELISESGEGSEFFFTVKLEIDQTSHQVEDKNFMSDEEISLKGKRLLLVEDNEINVEVALFLLKDLGAEIEVANNGKEAIDKFFNSAINYFDAILMDIQMPIMDGLEATREIRKNTSRKDAKTVPIIAMTANAFDEDMKKSIESGMNGHVAKPIEVEKIISALKSVFEEQRLKGENYEKN